MDFELRHGMRPYTPRNIYAVRPAQEADEAAGPAKEFRLRSHPGWIGIEQAILKALQPFMHARDAVARALAEIEPLPLCTVLLQSIQADSAFVRVGLSLLAPAVLMS